MKAKAKIELDVLIGEVSSLEEAKTHVRKLLEKLTKVSNKARCVKLDLAVDGPDISDLVVTGEK